MRSASAASNSSRGSGFSSRWKRRSRNRSSTPGRTSKCTVIVTVDRAFDNQRLHFTALQNEAAERHFADKRDIAKATYETNVAQQSEKQDRELKAKLDEQAQDRQELDVARQTRQAYVNTSDLLKF
jgi:hypothetical protein